MKEVDFDKYSINVSMMETEAIMRYIDAKEQVYTETQTELHIAWEELRKRGVLGS